MAISVAARKAKGRRLQQWTAAQISKILGIPWGKDELIRSREGAQSGTDVVLVGIAKELMPYSIECKSCENISLPAWIQQTKANQEEGCEFLLITKRSREKPLAILDAEHFFDLYEELIGWRENDIC